MDECNGLGTIICLCGGDLCVCEWHGEIPCDGCDDCMPAECTCYEAQYGHMPGCAFAKPIQEQVE